MATYFDLVRRFVPDASDEVCDYLLWNATCYPFGRLLQVSRQLKQIGIAIKNKQAICFKCEKHYDRDKPSFEDLCGDCE